jgi:hypothetical protein
MPDGRMPDGRMPNRYIRTRLNRYIRFAIFGQGLIAIFVSLYSFRYNRFAIIGACDEPFKPLQ